MSMPGSPRVATAAVVIGTSAGGLDALRILLAALPSGFGAAVLIVQHLPSAGAQGLIPLLAECCRLPVAEALDKQPVRPGTVTLAPADYHLLVEPDARLSLSVDPPVNYARPAIDPLFESAAAVYGERLLALVLTGANHDGSAGAAEVRRCGGRVWVQHPDDAYAAAMPAAALQRAGADRVGQMHELAGWLAAEGTR